MPITCDVLVVGGGAAGVAAAMAAGRAGARVVLLERYGFLGGLATAAQVGTICGLYLRDTAGAEAIPVTEGFPMEFAARLQSTAGSKPLRVDRGLWVLPYSPSAFARVADALVGETRNLTLMLHTTVANARAESSRIREISALAWHEPVLFCPTAVVDCTGEATAAALGGSASENGATDQAPALVFVLEDVDPGVASRGLLEVRRELRLAVERGMLPALCERISLIPGSHATGAFAFKLSLLPADPTLALWQQITNWEREARALLEPLVNFLTSHVAAFRNSYLASVAPQLGVRSGRRIIGRGRLTNEDVLHARKTATGIARGAWPMERWGAGPRPEMTYFAERDFYEIPLACLRPAELDNLFVAGRCLSAETGAMTSARVIGTALATGWAAGTAAAGILDCAGQA
ncbi:MAG TPA: FAD-dependent oxidoreductase [Candidatus Acidoferrales bacterium]|nr:FAD-dependent oxidoreductase [Candidatus Acidoferrales bacterium]